jgi:hypothetical protein
MDSESALHSLTSELLFAKECQRVLDDSLLGSVSCFEKLLARYELAMVCQSLPARNCHF